MVFKRIRVLIVDDSPLVCDILSKGLALDPAIEVIGTAKDPYDARDKIVALKPDVLTLDIEMPRMNGVEFLKKLMPQYPIPVIMVSSLSEKGARITLEALGAGAVDFVTKPSQIASLELMLVELQTKIKIAAVTPVKQWQRNRDEVFAHMKHLVSNNISEKYKIICMGASTGGTDALLRIMKVLPPNLPGIVIVQHMPKDFTKLFAENMNNNSHINISEAKHGDIITAGHAYVAPGGQQLRVVQMGGSLKIELTNEGPVGGHCPAVDVMFNSVASICAKKTIGIILTGMGQDGAMGLKALRDAGAHTIGQDAATSVVYGMPKVAFEKGGVEHVLPLQQIPQQILNLLKSEVT